MAVTRPAATQGKTCRFVEEFEFRERERATVLAENLRRSANARRGPATRKLHLLRFAVSSLIVAFSFASSCRAAALPIGIPANNIWLRLRLRVDAPLLASSESSVDIYSTCLSSIGRATAGMYVPA